MKPDPITQRFLLAMYEIIATKEKGCDNISKFCEKMGIHKQNISPLRTGERSVNLKEITLLNKHFKYSPNWIILEKGEKKIK